MKFTLGAWMNRENVKPSNIVQIREIKVEKNRVYLFSVPYADDRRSMDGPVMESYISSPQPNIIRFEAHHFMGSNQKEPKFDIVDNNCELDVTETEKGIEIKNGDTRLVIEKMPAKFTYYYKDKKLTNIADRFGSAMMSVVDTPEGRFMRGQLQTDIGEKIYGLGERFSPFVKNGQVVDIWNEDGGTASEIAYKNIPFYITNRNYGVFVNSTDKVSYEVCSEAISKVQFSVPGEKLDFMVIGGESMNDVLKSYTDLTGKPALPPAWSFGLWLTSSFTTSYDEETVTSFVNGMKERNIPLHVFHFDCFWMKENEWCGFEWDKNMFADPSGLLNRLKTNYDLKICVWINSYIGQKSALFKEAKDLGYLLKRPNGDVWQGDLWQGGLAIVDFTNPDAYKWYQDKLRVLLDQGVDTFKTDFGERIPTDVVYHDGSNSTQMHNYYTYLYNKCVFELLQEYKGKEDACVFARSATAGGQKFPVHWGGDCNSTYVSMSESLRGGLSLCMSGFSFWSHDISGFEGTAPSDVYKRWAVFGLLSTHSRLHGAKSYRVPWLFGDEAVDVVRYFTNLKCSLMPYLYQSAVYSSKTGVPVMRAMVLEFQNDLNCEDLDRQYMLGDSILVAPVFKENGDVDYYLPKGKWTHLLNNKVVEGNGWVRENYGFMSLPLFVKENSIVAIGDNNSEADYDYLNGTTLNVFNLTGQVSTELCDSLGNKKLEVSASIADNKVTIELDGSYKNLKILMRNVESVVDLSGAVCEKHELGTLIILEDNMDKISFAI